MTTNTVAYCNCMEEVKDRVSLVQSVGAHSVTTGKQIFDVELVFLQLRKTLELIAFASLIAHKQKYSAAHKNFASHWRAKDMLEALEKINPDFYPVPIEKPQRLPSGAKHCERVPGGFMTKDDFVLLYDKSSEIIHTGNPFTTKGPTIHIGYSVKDWVSRIQKLLALHLIHLADDSKWIVQISNSGPVRLYSASPAM